VAIPIKYNLRNLVRRKVRTGLTLGGITLVVLVGVMMFAFSRGMLHMSKRSGSPDNILIIDRKGQTCLFSSIKTPDYTYLKGLPEIRKNDKGEVMISPEIVHQVHLSGGAFSDRPGVVRGVTPMAFEVNDSVRMIKGIRPSTGNNIAVGELAHVLLGIPAAELDVGKEVQFLDTTWRVAGIYTAGGTALDAHIMAEMSELMAAIKRQSYSTAIFKMKDPAKIPPLVADLNSRNDIFVKAFTETDYYRERTEGFGRIIFLAVMMSLIAAIGGLVGGMNTMYASVLGRIREIATLQVLGFRKGAIILSFVTESVLIALVAGVIGCSAAFLVHGIPAKFSGIGAFTIHVDWIALVGGMVLALVIGVIGAIPPSLRAVRMEIRDALRFI
jgi:ABC-type antimicrobial peptide transport system permease subunit